MMISIKKPLAFLLLAAMTILLLLPASKATVESFTVGAGQEEIRVLDLANEDHVQIRFTVTGRTTNVLDFCITNPRENVMDTFNNTGSVSYAFVCSLQGEYTLHFSNIASADDKFVSLDYEVDHYTFGMPQMLFLTIIIAFICVAMVAVFIRMSKHP
jgi:hypothetical protein